MSQKNFTLQDRVFVLKFISTIQNEHSKQISSLQSRIKELQNLKQSITKQLLQTSQSLKLSQQTIQKLQQQLKISSLESTQNSTKINQNEEDPMTKYLGDAPHQILKLARSIKPSSPKVSQEDLKGCQGKIECIIWSRDQLSLQRYQKISRHYISGLLKGEQKSKVQMMMVYNHI